MKKYRVCLQEDKIRLLAETMTECYHKLASKKNLIDKITMDPVTLDFQYTNAKGDVIPKTSLSAGEMQLMVISLLWSLALSSKWKLPVIIDTPLSRLDSAHRLSLINIYFPQASEQTIIKNWNILCRWALCYSLSEHTIPTDLPVKSDSNVEMSWYTFAGEYSELYEAVIKAWCIQAGLPTDDGTVIKYFKLHLERGILYIFKRSR